MYSDNIDLEKTWSLWLECSNCRQATYEHEYESGSRDGVLKKARDDGWIVNLKTGQAYCPVHNTEKQ